MKAAGVLVYLVAVVLLGVTLAWLLAFWLDLPYHKLVSRAVLLSAAVGLVPLWRIFGLSASSIGAKPLPAVSSFAVTFAVGLLLLLPPVLFFVVVGFRVLDTEVAVFHWSFLGFLGMALLGAVLVGVFEELLFRGLMYSALITSAGLWGATVCSSAVYAAMHFVATDVGPEGLQVTWSAGLTYVLSAFGGLAEWRDYWDSFLSLFLLGVLFCVMRRHYGLWVCISLHAAWVFGIRTLKELTVRDIVNPYQGWAGTYDNFVGPLVSVWLVFILLVLFLARRHRARL